MPKASVSICHKKVVVRFEAGNAWESCVECVCVCVRQITCIGLLANFEELNEIAIKDRQTKELLERKKKVLNQKTKNREMEVTQILPWLLKLIKRGLTIEDSHFMMILMSSSLHTP